MRIEHVAIWTRNLEALGEFYRTYFQARASAKYVNRVRGFESYFLTLPTGARLELMSIPSLEERPAAPADPWTGYAHLAIAVGSRQEVDRLSAQLKEDGHSILDGPRFTGDGYYEVSLLDPDGNLLEITI